MNALRQYTNFDKLSFENICFFLSMKRNFSLARYGDGEFSAILGRAGANCDGHKYYPALGARLKKIFLKRPAYYVGIHHSEKLGTQYYNFLKDNEFAPGEFVDNSVFHYPVKFDKMGVFWSSLKDREVVVISPAYVKRQEVIPHARHIAIPGRDTYESLDKLLILLNMFDFTDKVVLVCASMTAPIIVDYLYERHKESATFIDFGSSFDPYVNVKSRSYHRHVTNNVKP